MGKDILKLGVIGVLTLAGMYVSSILTNKFITTADEVTTKAKLSLDDSTKVVKD